MTATVHAEAPALAVFGPSAGEAGLAGARQDPADLRGRAVRRTVAASARYAGASDAPLGGATVLHAGAPLLGDAASVHAEEVARAVTCEQARAGQRKAAAVLAALGRWAVSVAPALGDGAAEARLARFASTTVRVRVAPTDPKATALRASFRSVALEVAAAAAVVRGALTFAAGLALSAVSEAAAPFGRLAEAEVAHLTSCAVGVSVTLDRREREAVAADAPVAPAAVAVRRAAVGELAGALHALEAEVAVLVGAADQRWKAASRFTGPPVGADAVVAATDGLAGPEVTALARLTVGIGGTGGGRAADAEGATEGVRRAGSVIAAGREGLAEAPDAQPCRRTRRVLGAGDRLLAGGRDHGAALAFATISISPAPRVWKAALCHAAPT